MNILGIVNRTENWKTASSFAPLLPDLGHLLASRLGDQQNTCSGTVRLELYWKGMRDYFHCHGGRKKASDDKDRISKIYVDLFSNLRDQIVSYGKFRYLQDCNYDVSKEEYKDVFVNNLYNTEIDIVLSSNNDLFIGEAKHEMNFHADSKLILVHQLMRQYVMARILVEYMGCKQRVVPFVVGDNVASLKRRHQVIFMLQQGWMREENVLAWSEIDDLAS